MPEGGPVERSKKSLSGFGPARRAGPDEIVGIVLECTVKEKIEVNFSPKMNVNLKKACINVTYTDENGTNR